jgi:hypothetical protein
VAPDWSLGHNWQGLPQFLSPPTRPNTTTFHHLTDLPTPRGGGLLQKLTVSYLLKKLPAYYGTQMFITVLRRVNHLSLSWARWIQSHTLISISILFSYVCLGPPNGIFHSGFPHKTSHAFLSFHMRYVLNYYIFLNLVLVIMFGEEYKLWSSSLYRPLQPPVMLSHLGPHTPLSTLFWNTLSLCSSLNH